MLIPVLALIGWLAVRGTPPPEVQVTRPKRETVVSTLTTNGKVEPVEWAAVNSEVAGPVLRVLVEAGQTVGRGQILASIGSAEAQGELSSAQSRVNAARAEVETLESGGRAPEQAEIESGLARAHSEMTTAQNEASALERLVSKNAATQGELTVAREAVRRAQLQIDSLERRRASLVSPPDRKAALARLQEAESGMAAAGRRITESQVRSPMNGVVYSLDLRSGAWVQPGTPVARVGKLDQLKVTVYVDEPELGRVSKGMPVSITWDALPGRDWKGQVQAVPLQVVPVGTRQVGEVVCLIDNPNLSLIPGTNITAEIRSRAVENAMTIPKEVLRREGNETGVYKISGDHIAWQRVRVGVASVTRIEVLEGLSETDQVVLPTDLPLKTGDRVHPLEKW